MRIRSLHLLAPAMALAIMIPAEALSQARAGAARGGAPVARAAVNPGPAQRAQGPRDVRSSAQRSVNPQGRGNVNGSNVNVGSGGNTVVVNNGRPMDQRRYGAPPPGYRSGGYYYGGGYYYDDDDNEFLEFFGKAAGVTAGAAIVVQEARDDAAEALLHGREDKARHERADVRDDVFGGWRL